MFAFTHPLNIHLILPTNFVLKLLFEFQRANFTFLLLDVYLTTVLAMYWVVCLLVGPGMSIDLPGDTASLLLSTSARCAEMRSTWCGTSTETSPACRGSFGDFMFYLPVSICDSPASGVPEAAWGNDELAACCWSVCTETLWPHPDADTALVCQKESDERFHETLGASFSKLWC